MQRRYVERFSLGTQSLFQAGSTKEQKSCLQVKRLCQTVPEAKENNFSAPDTIQSEHSVTCCRVKSRYTKLSVFPDPVTVWRRSSPGPIAEQCCRHCFSHTLVMLGHAIVLKGGIQNYLCFQLRFLYGEAAAQVPSYNSVTDTGFHTHW